MKTILVIQPLDPDASVFLLDRCPHKWFIHRYRRGNVATAEVVSAQVSDSVEELLFLNDT